MFWTDGENTYSVVGDGAGRDEVEAAGNYYYFRDAVKVRRKNDEPLDNERNLREVAGVGTRCGCWDSGDGHRHKAPGGEGYCIGPGRDRDVDETGDAEDDCVGADDFGIVVGGSRGSRLRVVGVVAADEDRGCPR